MCVQLGGATGTNTTGVDKVGEREKKEKSKIRSHKAGSDYPKTVEEMGSVKWSLMQQIVVGNARCIFRQKSAYNVNRKALKC